MSDDNSKLSMRGTGGAIKNDIRFRDVHHPWHLLYLNTCIIKDCRTKPYYDGSTYFTCCLSCLREKELGPFFGNPNPRLHNAEGQTPKLPKVATQAIEPDVEADGVVIPLDSNDLF